MKITNSPELKSNSLLRLQSDIVLLSLDGIFNGVKDRNLNLKYFLYILYFKRLTEEEMYLLNTWRRGTMCDCKHDW